MVRGLSLQKLVHKDPNDVSVFVPDILVFSVHVVGAEDDVIQAKLMLCGLKIQFNGIFRDAIGIFRLRDHIFCHRQLIGPIDSNGGRKHEAFNVVQDAQVDQVDRTDQIRFIIVAPDKVTQALCSVGCQMIDVIEPFILKEILEQSNVSHRPLHPLCPPGNVVEKPAAQVVQSYDLHAVQKQVLRHVGANKPGGAGNQYLHVSDPPMKIGHAR